MTDIPQTSKPNSCLLCRNLFILDGYNNHYAFCSLLNKESYWISNGKNLREELHYWNEKLCTLKS